MNFDVIINNPPYQLNDKGFGRSASPIYQYFIQQAKKLNPRFLIMIIPAKWYSAGKALDEFRKEMLHDDRIREIHDFPDALHIFPDVQISGGVCFFKRDRHLPGPPTIFNYMPNYRSIQLRPFLEPNLDTFIRFNEAISIIQKVRNFNEPSIKNIVSPSKPFGFPTNYLADTIPFHSAIKLYHRGGHRIC